MTDNDNPIDNDNHSHLDNVSPDVMPDALKADDISMDDNSMDAALIPDNVDTSKDKGGRPPLLPNGDTRN